MSHTWHQGGFPCSAVDRAHSSRLAAASYVAPRSAVVNHHTTIQSTRLTSPLSPSAVNSGLASRKTNTSSALAPRSEHRCVPIPQVVKSALHNSQTNTNHIHRMYAPQHIRHNEKPHMASPNVHLVEMRDAAVARRDGNILELNVHIIFGCYGAQSSVIHFLFIEPLCIHMASGLGTLRKAKE